MSDLKNRLDNAARVGALADNDALGVVFGTVCNGQEIKKIALSQLIPWSSAEYEGQPFRPYAPQEMGDMMDSLNEHGLHIPIIVRPINGKYQILAGHNRTQAARNLGWTEIDALIKPAGLSDAEAAAILVDTNFYQRPRILPSERAWGWKIKMDSMRHQGTSSHDGTKLRSDAKLGKDEGKGRSTIQRYISLTNLIRPLLDIVDGYQYDNAGEWALNPEKPLIPITAAEKLVELSQGDQEYIVTLFTARRITGITSGQAAELKAMRHTIPKSEDMPPRIICRCLRLEESKAEEQEKPCIVRFSLPSKYARHIKIDPALYILVTQTIEKYLSNQEQGDVK